MSRKLRNIKPKKVNRGAFEEQKLREENKTQNQRALLFILPLVMLAVLAVGIFFGWKFYLNSAGDRSPVSPSESFGVKAGASNPLFLRAVSSASPLEESFVPETVESCGVAIAPEAAEGLEKMLADVAADGCALQAAEGYVSYAEQQQRYENAVEAYRKSSKSSLVMAEAHVKRELPPAGESEQQTGLLVYLTADTDESFDGTPAFSWLERHGVDYGFILRYPDKENAGGVAYSSHLFRFVGREYAYQMRELDMNFDEFLVYLKAK